MVIKDLTGWSGKDYPKYGNVEFDVYDAVASFNYGYKASMGIFVVSVFLRRMYVKS